MSADRTREGKELWSSDRAFGVKIESTALLAMVEACKAAGNVETGGILIGRYREAHDCAIVTEATGPGGGSQRGSTWFERGIGYLQKKLQKLWQGSRSYYLGEWHYHPNAAPEPSSVESDTMFDIARSSKYACPEPILIIVGGDPHADWDVGATVYLRRGGVVRLHQSPA